MKLSEGIFAAKLYELERQYGLMQSRLRLCQQEDHKKSAGNFRRLLMSTGKMSFS